MLIFNKATRQQIEQIKNEVKEKEAEKWRAIHEKHIEDIEYQYSLKLQDKDIIINKKNESIKKLNTIVEKSATILRALKKLTMDFKHSADRAGEETRNLVMDLFNKQKLISRESDQAERKYPVFESEYKRACRTIYNNIERAAEIIKADEKLIQ